MQVVLLEKVGNLGTIGAVVSVKNGYARNYLLPRKKALRATKDNLAYFESQRKQIEADNQRRKEEAQKLAESMTDLVLDVIRQAGESGHLFGSVRSADVADVAAAKGFAVDKSQVVIQSPIKTLGVHEVRIVLHPEVVVSVRVNVAQTEEEAQAQLDAILNPEAKASSNKSQEKSEDVGVSEVG